MLIGVLLELAMLMLSFEGFGDTEKMVASFTWLTPNKPSSRVALAVKLSKTISATAALVVGVPSTISYSSTVNGPAQFAAGKPV